MGLLDKASSSIKDSSSGGLFLKAQVSLGSTDDAVGVKKKNILKAVNDDGVWLTSANLHEQIIDSYSTSKETVKPLTPLPDVENKRESFGLDRLSSIKEGIETPANIFALLREEFSIEKGAMLLQDPEEEVFLPWALLGYDRTTSHRLRLPKNLTSSFLGEGEVSCFFSNTVSEFQFLSQFFSNREFGLLETVLICPIREDAQFLGLVLITKSPLLAAKENIIPNLTTFLKAAFPILNNAREGKLKKLSYYVSPVKEDIIGETQKFFQTAVASGKTVLLLMFSISNIIDRLHRKIKEVDPYRIRRDIISILSSMMTENGLLLALDNVRFLLLFGEKTFHDESLLIHQISLALNDFFEENLHFDTLIDGVLRKPLNELEIIQFIESRI